MGWIVVGPISKIAGAVACAGSKVTMGLIAGASAGSTAGITLIMAGAAMGGTIGIRWLTMGASIVRSTIGALVMGVAVNSNKVVKQHDGEQESSPLTLFGSPQWSAG